MHYIGLTYKKYKNKYPIEGANYAHLKSIIIDSVHVVDITFDLCNGAHILLFYIRINARVTVNIA